MYCTVYIFGGKRFDCAPLDKGTLCTIKKHPALWGAMNMLEKGERPLSFRHGDIDHFTTKLLCVKYVSNPELKISLTKSSGHSYVCLQMTPREKGRVIEYGVRWYK